MEVSRKSIIPTLRIPEPRQNEEMPCQIAHWTSADMTIMRLACTLTEEANLKKKKTR